MKQKLLAAVAGVAAIGVATAIPHEAEARGGGRVAAGIALGLAGAAIIGSSRYYDDPYYYDSGSYYDDGYNGPPRRYYRHHRHYNGANEFQRNYRGEASDD